MTKYFTTQKKRYSLKKTLVYTIGIVSYLAETCTCVREM